MKKLVLLIAMLTPFFSSASEVDSTISYVRVDDNGHGLIQFTNAIIGPSDCTHPAWRGHYSFDLKTEAGRAIYSLALTAHASNKKIKAYGKGQCLQYIDAVESWAHGFIY
ncbi:hypothetical protein ACU6U9_01770 [Pseudomonas sp. HK3]